MDIKALIKAVGTGIKGNRDFTFNEAQEALTLLLDPTIALEQKGALLIGWRVKLETNEELKAAYSALYKTFSLPNAEPDSIELAYSLDGKSKNIPLIFLCARLLPNESFVLTTSKANYSESSTLHELANSYTIHPNIKLFYQEEIAPRLSAVQEIRNNLGVRTIFNTLEKLHDPLKSDYAVVGAHHGPYFEKYASLYKDRYKRLLIVQGDEGSAEVIAKAKVHAYTNGELVEERYVDPKAFSILFSKPKERLSKEEMLLMLQHPTQELLDLARLNASIISYAKDPSKSIEEYFEKLS